MTDERYHGLSDAQVAERVEKGQINQAEDNLFKSKKEIIMTHTLTYFNFLNLFLGVLILISGQFKNITFMGVIIINSVIGIVQELKVKSLVDKLSVMTATKTTVIRGGSKQQIPVSEIVLDDLMQLENGDQVCADAEVLESAGMEVNESMLTGESKPVKKKPGDKLMSGSYLVAGTGLAKVEHVGDDNYAVQLSKKAKTKKRASSEMQRTIQRIIKVLGVLIIPIGILLFMSQRNVEGSTLSDCLVGTVAGVIGMIPEGLVLLTSVSFILGVGRLAKKRALVQEMEAIEALARVNVLCLDKTGTITTGELEVKEVAGLGDTTEDMVHQIMNEMAFSFEDVNNTQNALMTYFTKTNAWTMDQMIPFSSERKYRAVSYVDKGAFVLGAPEFLVKREENPELLKQIDGYADQGLRVLLLGKCQSISPEEGTVSGVTPAGLVIISDCIRPEAPATFAYFKEQNVDIKVISGDNPATVSQIAVKAGLEGAQRYVDANTLPEDFEQLRTEVKKYTVYGRVKPEKKQQIIKAYQANKNIVGMVGDGVNDVLALKDADCGIAMAAGSDAAKQVAHIVLLDSNFACLKNIVSEGRMIITNIERVSALYLTKTIYSVFLCIFFSLMAREYPFIPIQLSWISSTAIGIPSFILTLERTESVNRSGFLKHVLQVALPSALTMVVSLLLIQALIPFWNGDMTWTYTYNILVGAAVSMMVVIRVCTPMTWLRRALSIGVAVLFLIGIVLLPGFFGINPIFQWETILVIPFIFMVVSLTRIFSQMVLYGYKVKDSLVKKYLQNKEV